MSRLPAWGLPLLALGLSLVLTSLVREIARRHGLVAKPKTDRWHEKPTAMLGGVAIFLAVNAVVLLVAFGAGHEALRKTILPASALLFAVGLLDDLRNLKPYQKLIGQIIGAAIIIYGGLVLPWTGSAPLNLAITVFWLIGITNAINMLDNMDGLAAGIAAIAAVFLSLYFLSVGQATEALVIMIFGAVLVGFLFYNFHPASIFMGDSGSMFIGLFLASTALLTTTSGRTRSFLPVIAVPVLILVIPIFDTTFVTLLRKLSGRAASQGGRDHTSHRLVALGLSERRAVWLLYGLAILSGFLAIQVRNWELHDSVAAILAFTVILTLIGVYLAGVKVYPPETPIKDRRLVAFFVDLSYKRRVFETLLDVSLIFLAYYMAYRFRFGAMAANDANLDLFIHSVPIIVSVKIGAFLLAGVYRGLWRYTSLHDLVVLAKANVLGSLISVMILLFVFRFEGFSPAVFLLDGLLLLFMTASSRVAFRLVRRLIPTPTMKAGRRVLIYGAGDAGELLTREFFNNLELQCLPVGFLDDDSRKAGKLLHGLMVYSGDSLPAVCESLQVEEVVISSEKISPSRLREIVHRCDSMGIPLRRMKLNFEPINAFQSDLLAAVEPNEEERKRSQPAQPSPRFGEARPRLQSDS